MGEPARSYYLISIYYIYITCSINFAPTLKNVSDTLSSASHIQGQPRDRFYCLSVVAPERSIVHEFRPFASAAIGSLMVGRRGLSGLDEQLSRIMEGCMHCGTWDRRIEQYSVYTRRQGTNLDARSKAWEFSSNWSPNVPFRREGCMRLLVGEEAVRMEVNVADIPSVVEHAAPEKRSNT